MQLLVASGRCIGVQYAEQLSILAAQVATDVLGEVVAGSVSACEALRHPDAVARFQQVQLQCRTATTLRPRTSCPGLCDLEVMPG